MNLSINNNFNNNYNTNFKGRYLRIHNEKEFPVQIYDALCENQSLKKFLGTDKPKTFVQKVNDFFTRDQYLDVYYEKKNNYEYDPYDITAYVHFIFDRGSLQARTGAKEATQQGIRRQTGSIAKPGENKLFKPPVEKVEDILAEKIRSIVDFDKFLH